MNNEQFAKLAAEIVQTVRRRSHEAAPSVVPTPVTPKTASVPAYVDAGVGAAIGAGLSALPSVVSGEYSKAKRRALVGGAAGAVLGSTYNWLDPQGRGVAGRLADSGRHIRYSLLGGAKPEATATAEVAQTPNLLSPVDAAMSVQPVTTATGLGAAAAATRLAGKSRAGALGVGHGANLLHAINLFRDTSKTMRGEPGGSQFARWQ